MKTISIFGTARAQAGSELYSLAFDLGSRLAEAGFALANGGYNGTMLAAAHGASVHRGEVIGVTCTAFKRGKANEYVTREISTASLEERLRTLISLADAFIILPGGTGTLLELAHVWELKNKHFIPEQKPVILLGPFWRPLVELVGRDDPDAGGFLDFAADPAEAVQRLQELLTTDKKCKL
jgi:uncharacterized protein (TIGR00730 family)